MHVLTVLGLLASVALSSPQDGDARTPPPTRLAGQVDPVSGAPMLVAKGVSAPSAGWSDAERAADAIAKGVAALDAAQKAYQDARSLMDRAEITIAMPDGEQNEVVDMAFGEGNDMLVRVGSLQICSVAGAVHFVLDQPEDRYLSRKLEGSANATLCAMLPNFELPVPDLAMRQPLPGTRAIDAFAMGGRKDLSVRGYREVGGRQEVLIGGAASESVVELDPVTRLVRRVEMLFTPEGLPEGVKIAFKVRLSPSIGPLKDPIAFDAGKRTAVSKLEELFAEAAEADAPGPTVKEGDMAPVASLASLGGGTVDLAALRGKVVVLDFWATWCGPCRKGLPLLQKFADSMKGNDRVAVYAVNVWEQPKGRSLEEVVSEFWTKQSFTIGVLLDPEAKLIGRYGFQGIPACVVIGPDGRLVASHMGFDADIGPKLAAEVNKALGAGK